MRLASLRAKFQCHFRKFLDHLLADYKLVDEGYECNRITSKDDCKTAATELNLYVDVDNIQEDANERSIPNCYYKPGALSTEKGVLYYNKDLPDLNGASCDKTRGQCVCRAP